MTQRQRKSKVNVRPTTEELTRELKRVRYNERYGRTIRSTIYILITVAAASILVATLVFPIFRIYGSSMSPTLEEGDIVASLRTAKFEHGDLVAFYYNNRLLVKRVIASGGEWVDIDQDGNVYVNNQLLDEPYVADKTFDFDTQMNIEIPYQVPDGRIFVMGDHRSTSVDSRMKEIGCISDDLIAGKLILRIWPLGQFKFN
ncbi:MAG: signal peptidase I [Solobacterium sp.]|jgi:signal peptidase I|nr:signal peptidase I [Solobacterium sp.]MBR3345348.1 signal peptidase I [Solobacterium sp.]HAE16703.1 signal peptidase I [Erysipelotrichaceae bacterium]